MARFPYTKSNTADLGRMLARAATDASFRKRLEDDPAKELRRIGLPPVTTELFDFKVVDACPDGGTVVMPYRLNRSKLDLGDRGYFETIGQSLTGGRVN
ncbi:MAG: hypothetical protein JJ902_03600 [Roseibium sp.]|nr:hypothetical protein [Roseibium sp.]